MGVLSKGKISDQLLVSSVAIENLPILCLRTLLATRFCENPFIIKVEVITCGLILNWSTMAVDLVSRLYTMVCEDSQFKLVVLHSDVDTFGGPRSFFYKVDTMQNNCVWETLETASSGTYDIIFDETPGRSTSRFIADCGEGPPHTSSTSLYWCSCTWS